MLETFSQLTQSIKPNIREINSDLIKYAGEIKFKKHEINIRELALEFGDYIFQDGEFLLKDPQLDDHFSFGLVLERGCETFLEGDSFTPLDISLPGSIFFIDHARGIEPLPPRDNLHMTAGARSLFLSAKISDSLAFGQMAKYYGLEQNVPRTHLHEWAMLRELAHNAGSPWRARILIISVQRDVFFSERCNRLRHGLRQLQSPYQSILDNPLLLDFEIRKFTIATQYKVHPSIAAHMQQLYYIRKHKMPGFSFAADETLAPINLFKQAFIQVYGITYAPSIALPGYPSAHQPCYYPLKNMEQALSKRSHTTSIEELKELKRTIPHFDRYLAQTHKKLDWLSFSSHDLVYFHHLADAKGNILPNTHLPEYDPIISTDLIASNLPFCEASPLFRSGFIGMKA